MCKTENLSRSTEHSSRRSCYDASSPSFDPDFDGRRSAAGCTGCVLVSTGEAWLDGGDPATWSRSSKLANALGIVRLLTTPMWKNLPERIKRRRILVLLLAGRRRPGAAAGGTVITAPNQVASRA